MRTPARGGEQTVAFIKGACDRAIALAGTTAEIAHLTRRRDRLARHGYPGGFSPPNSMFIWWLVDRRGADSTGCTSL
ncbi:hypothetical protein [Lentzea cavernae]|uniref:hypothetical protein n=1 Tax=Lentzea cavernae TaxID=2020703 RepID=UPI00174C9CAA|nr:hypothetical protein [Lentzea cavernae]